MDVGANESIMEFRNKQVAMKMINVGIKKIRSQNRKEEKIEEKIPKGCPKCPYDASEIPKNLHV